MAQTHSLAKVFTESLIHAISERYKGSSCIAPCLFIWTRGFSSVKTSSGLPPTSHQSTIGGEGKIDKDSIDQEGGDEEEEADEGGDDDGEGDGKGEGSNKSKKIVKKEKKTDRVHFDVAFNSEISTDTSKSPRSL